MITIAVLSDTHGLLRPEIPSAIKDVDHIIHAGEWLYCTVSSNNIP